MDTIKLVFFLLFFSFSSPGFGAVAAVSIASAGFLGSASTLVSNVGYGLAAAANAPFYSSAANASVYGVTQPAVATIGNRSATFTLARGISVANLLPVAARLAAGGLIAYSLLTAAGLLWDAVTKKWMKPQEDTSNPVPTSQFPPGQYVYNGQYFNSVESACDAICFHVDHISEHVLSNSVVYYWCHFNAQTNDSSVCATINVAQPCASGEIFNGTSCVTPPPPTIVNVPATLPDIESALSNAISSNPGTIPNVINVGKLPNLLTGSDPAVVSGPNSLTGSSESTVFSTPSGQTQKNTQTNYNFSYSPATSASPNVPTITITTTTTTTDTNEEGVPSVSTATVSGGSPIGPLPNANPYPYPPPLGDPTIPTPDPNTTPIPNPDPNTNPVPPIYPNPYPFPNTNPYPNVTPDPNTNPDPNVTPNPNINPLPTAPDSVPNINADPNENPDESPPFDLCVEHPDILACQKLGGIPDKEQLPESNQNFDLDPVSVAGSCPPDTVINLILAGPQVISWQPLCDIASYVRLLVIAASWLSAGIFFVNSIK